MKPTDVREELMEAIRSEHKLRPTPGRIGNVCVNCFCGMTEKLFFVNIIYQRVDSGEALLTLWLHCVVDGVRLGHLIECKFLRVTRLGDHRGFSLFPQTDYNI